MHYIVATLDPRSSAQAREANNAVLARGRVLGIEVTHEGLARECVLGNIDPQHGPGGDAGQSAIERALTVPLPEPGAVLATIRPDSDSVGAMAVLEERADGEAGAIDAGLCEAIGRHDGLGPQALRLPEVQRHLDEINAASYLCLSRTHTLEEKVRWMQRLICRRLGDQEIQDMADEAGRQLDEARKELQVTLFPGGRVALVQGNSPRGFDVAYSMGVGIVICYAPRFVRPGAGPDELPVEKWTIGRYSRLEPIDMAGLAASLNRLEEEWRGEGRWGGPQGLVASPQGQTSAIPQECVVAAVLQAVTS